MKLAVYYQYILRPRQTIDAGNVEKNRSKLNNDMGKSSQ